ncbi:MAG: thiol-disulfide oxidoreductase DCC family protein [Thermosynechococcaceae cyanobacterium]
MPSALALVAQGQGSCRATPSWKVKLLYDGACPLCVREVNFLSRRDAGRGLVAFVDIAADDYRPEDNGDIDFETAMGRIHAIAADGTVLRNVEVFRTIYSILGMGWVYAATQWPIIGPLVDQVYALWADWRLALTGRPNLATVIAQREQHLGRCRLDQSTLARKQ